MLLEIHAFINSSKLVDMVQWTQINGSPRQARAGGGKFAFCDVIEILDFDKPVYFCSLLFVVCWQNQYI
jgi:hypothetical protein